MRVFIDGGGNWRRTVDRYLKLSSFDKVYVFEPNPIFYQSYEGSDFILVKKAIWIKECVMPLYTSRDENQVASSIFQEKLCKKKSPDGLTDYIENYWNEPVMIECVDFSKWLKENIEESQNVTLKLDIEGCEYDVLWKMIEEGTIGMIDELYVEFHSETMPTKRETEKKLIEALGLVGVSPKDWD